MMCGENCSFSEQRLLILLMMMMTLTMSFSDIDIEHMMKISLATVVWRASLKRM